MIQIKWQSNSRPTRTIGPNELSILLSDQREARDYLAEHPGHCGAKLGIADSVMEETLMHFEEESRHDSADTRK